MIFLLISFNLFAGGLNNYAEFIKQKDITAYEKTIKKHAVEKWGDDHQMVVYTINQQCEAFMVLVQKNDIGDNYEIFIKALMKWAIDGYYDYNYEYIQKPKKDGLPLLELHCDWQMVLYTYENQLSAKNQY